MRTERARQWRAFIFIRLRLAVAIPGPPKFDSTVADFSRSHQAVQVFSMD